MRNNKRVKLETESSSKSLTDREFYFSSLYENVPISIWEEDFSYVKKMIDELAIDDEDQLTQYLDDNPKFVKICANKVKIININQAAVKLHRAKTKQEIVENLIDTFTEKSYSTFKQELIQLHSGKTEFNVETDLKDFNGNILHVILKWVIPSGYEYNWSKILVIIVNITERKEMEENIQTQSKYQEVLVKLGQLAIKETNLQTLLDHITQTVIDTLDVDYCKMLELSKEKDQLLMVSGAGWREGVVHHTSISAKNESQAGYTLLTKEPVIVTDLNTETRFSSPPLLVEHQVISGVSVIIQQKGEPYGVLGIHSTKSRDFNEIDINFINVIAIIIGDAVERSKIEKLLKEQTQNVTKTNQDLNTLISCTNAVMYAKDEHKLLQKICDIIVSNEKFSMSWIGYSDDSLSKIVSVMAYSGQVDNYLNNIIIKWDESQFGMGPTGRAIREETTVIANNIYEFENYTPWLDKAKKRGYNSSIAIPLIHDKTCFGALNIYSNYINTYTNNEVELLERLANNLAFGIKSIRTNRERNEFLDHLQIHETELIKLTTIIEQTPSLIIILDLDGNITYVNPKFSQVTGYSRKNAIGMHCTVLTFSAIQTENQPDFLKMIARGDEWQGVSQFQTQDGNYYWALTSFSPVYNQSGELMNYLMVQKDITEQKEIENELLKAQKMEAIGKLAGAIAHDFNNYLTAILGYTDILNFSLLERDLVFSEIDEIKKTTLKASNLTKQLLTFGSENPLTLEVFDLKLLIKGIRSLLNRIIKSEIKLEFDLWENPSLIVADPGKIEQILVNLVINASEAIEKNGFIKITTSKINIKDTIKTRYSRIIPQEYIKLTIEDSGKGIRDNDLQDIFEPFFTTKNRGTGLGLTIVSNIIKQSHGYINVNSKRGQGTTMEIYLPCAKEVSLILHEELHESMIEISDKKILVVDDESDVLNVISELLIKKGNSVLKANNPYNALSIYKENLTNNFGIDLIITDVKMEGMNGVELIDELLKYDENVRVLFISGFTENHLSLKKYHNKNIDFLMKPFTYEKLEKKLYRLFKN